MDLVFATNNAGKLSEAQDIVKNHKIISLKDINCFDDLPETHETIFENAEEKAMYLWDKYHLNCFSDDTGLEVEALNGAPGVYSARYAGQQKNPEDNMRLLLENLKYEDNRKARFHTEVVLILDGKIYHFEGYVNGIITREKRGNLGFGYDPIFQPEGYKITMAEMTADEKNKISHRGMALKKMGKFLLDY